MGESEIKYSVVIADANRNFMLLLKEYLSQMDRFEVIDFAFSGKEAIEKYEEHHPDFMILDLVLPMIDGFGVIEEIISQESAERTRIIVSSSVGMDFIVKKALGLGVDYFFIKPFDFHTFKNRMDDVVKNISLENGESQELPEKVQLNFTGPKRNDDYMSISDLIQYIGIPAHVKGYYYIREAVYISLREEKSLGNFSKKIYPKIAEKYNTTSICVERNIRHAIESAWNKGNLKVLDTMFGYTINAAKGKPTNREFIAMLVDRIRILNTDVD